MASPCAQNAQTWNDEWGARVISDRNSSLPAIKMHKRIPVSGGTHSESILVSEIKCDTGKLQQRNTQVVHEKKG